MPKVERVLRILDRLKEGASSADILHELELRDARYQLAIERGHKSEQCVRTILSEQPMVERVIQSVHSGEEDKRGIDLQVFLRKREFGLSMNWVSVQVKSSPGSIGRFKQVYMVKHKLEAGEVEEHMRLNRMVILNGRDNEQTIIDSFLQQVKAIDALRGQRFSQGLSMKRL